MRTNKTTIKGFKAVDFMREVRDKISMDIKDMNFEEIQKYMQERRQRLTYGIGIDANVTEGSVVAEPHTDTHTVVDKDMNSVTESKKSISASESAKQAFNRLGEKYNCTFDNKYTK